jgi:hypothetical protein
MSPAQSIHPPTLLRLLRGIDGLPPGATGALVFTAKDAPQGTVLIEDRRVCWAAASDMQNRLTDILRAQSDRSIEAEVFEEIYSVCYREKKPLGETLVARGLVTRDGLKCALRQHTAEAIARLSTAPRLTLTWASNRSRRYSANYTFGTPELLCHAAAFGIEDLAEEARRKLEDMTPANAVGVALLADARHSVPLAQVAAEDWASQSLVDLGEWARKAIREETLDETGSVLASDTVHSLKRAWRSGSFIFARWTGATVPTASRPAERFDLTAETQLTR